MLNAIAELGPGLTRKMLVAVFNKRFSVAYEGGKTAVIWSAFDALLQRDHIERASFEDFKKVQQPPAHCDPSPAANRPA